MQAPLSSSRKKKWIDLSNEGLSLSLKKKTNDIKNKEFNSIQINSKISSYSPTSLSTLRPISLNRSLQTRELREGNLANKGKINLVHSNISGIKLKLGGRLEKTSIIPRKSSKEILMGNMSRGTTSFKNSSRITYKNKRGAYSITVSSSYLSHKCHLNSLPFSSS
jgi:hypothetical protein